MRQLDFLGLIPQEEWPHDDVVVGVEGPQEDLVLLGVKGPAWSRLGHDEFMLHSVGLLALEDAE